MPVSDLQAIVMRGISGAGKSTLVAKRWPEAEVVCSDDYFPMPRPKRLTKRSVRKSMRVFADKVMPRFK